MSKYGNILRQHVASNGNLAKTLTIIYALMFIIVVAVTINIYKHPKHNSAYWSLFGFSVLISLIPAFISILYEGTYAVFLYGQYNRGWKKHFDKMDERQQQTRLQIFERSYACLTTIIFLFLIWGSNWFGNYLSKDGVFIIGYNVLFLAISLPTIVAVWDKNPVTHATE